MEPSAAAYPHDIQALTERLRRFIRESVPEAEERVYKGGSGMGYHAPRCGAFCGLFLRRDAVYLAFPYGDRLPDPEGLLEAGGRYVVFRPGDDVPEDALFHLLVAALLVGADAHR